ncbi:1479_t:CDS:2 [Diversispora eburnea]|uniref:1479_t:CDS:1 n=1 Tax=Diversispora eburnea TaxID=1213867 RepID=A0A9N8ZCY0_9GLOM|nr:1479_t:CDS:2 [Diversispora eburnea]
MNSTDIISSLESIETFDSFDTVVANDHYLQIQNQYVNNMNNPPLQVHQTLNSLLTSEEWQTNGDLTFLRDFHLLEMLLQHLSSLEDSVQSQVIDRLISFTEYCDMNKWIMFKANITSELLTSIIWRSWNMNEISEKTMRLLEIICSYSVKVSNVKSMLNMICNKNDNSDDEDNSQHQEDSAWYQGALLKLLYSIAPKQNTLDFFYFKGIESGIELSAIEKFPQNGYSFFTWIKMDPIPSPKERKEHGNYVPRLFSFFNDFGDGIEAYFENNELCFQCKKGEIISKVIMNTFKFTQKRWYFISIVHHPEKRGWTITPSEINIVVDGHIYFNSRLEYPLDYYPKFITPFSYCSIGASMSIRSQSKGSDDESSNSSTSTPSTGLYNCFRGQMTALYMLNEVLTIEQTSAIYELGLNHSTQLELEQKIDNSTSCCNLFDGTLSSKLLFNFHVKASSDQKCFNLAPYSVTTPINATLFGIEKCSTLSLRNAIQCLGDVEILFPMIMRFDDVSLQAPFDSQDNFFSSVGPCKAFFALLSSLLQSNTISQNHIIKSRGIKIIGLLLQQVGPRHLSISAFQSMIGLANSLEANEDLTREIHSHLVFEFRIWMYSSMEIQKYCIEFLKNFIDARKQMCRELFGVQFILDTLSCIYWYKQSEISEPHRHQSAGVTRPKSSQIKELRGILLSIIISYFKDGIYKDEVLGIFRNLLAGDDDVHMFEILTLLLDLLTSKSCKSMVDIFASYRGYEILCELLKRKDENVKLICIKIITFLINSSHTPPRIVKKLRFVDTDTINLIKLLDGTPFTFRIYHGLLYWALEQFYPYDLIEKEDMELSQFGLPKIKNVRITVVILSLLYSEGTKQMVQCKVLEDLVKVFGQNISICDELCRIWNWQRYLIRLVPMYNGQERISNERLNKDTADWALELLATVIWNMFEVDRNAYKIVDETILYIWTSERPDSIETIRALLYQLLSLITREIKLSLVNSFSPTKLENVIRLTTLTEEILFNHRDLLQKQSLGSNGQKEPLSSSYSLRSTYEYVMPSFNMMRFEDTVISNFPAFSSIQRNDDVFQSASNPWEDNKDLTEIYLEIIDMLDKSGNWRMEVPNRNEISPGEICRMVMRALIAGITLQDHKSRENSLDKLMGFVERHVKAPDVLPLTEQKTFDDFYCRDSDLFKQHILMVLGEVHDAFM